MGGGKDLGSALSIAMSIAIGLTSLAMMLRCYVRIGIQRTFTLDDYILLFSQLCFIAFTGITFQYLKESRGVDPTDLRTHHWESPADLFKLWWLGQQFSILSAYGVKIAIVVYFNSLEPPPKLQIATIATGVVTVVAGIATQLFELLFCRPIAYYWLRAAPNSTAKGSCLSGVEAIALWQTLNSMCILLDVVLVLLPCILVWNLQMKRSSKIWVAILLGPGGFPVIAAILRSVYFARLSTHTSQVTYTQIPMRLTKVVEISIPIIVVCIARLRPLIRKITSQNWFPSSRDTPVQEIPTIGRYRARPHDPPYESELSFYGRLDSATHIEPKPGS